MNKVSLRISCENLPSFDLLSKSDPFVVAFELTKDKKKKYVQLGHTEAVKNDNNPIFVRTIPLYFHSSIEKTLFFEIFDCDSDSNKVTDHDYVGRTSIHISDLIKGEVTQPVETNIPGFNGELKGDGGKQSLLTVTPEIFKQSRNSIHLTLRGIELAKKDFFSSDPFFEIKREYKGKMLKVYQSKYISSNLNPSWEPLKISSLELCDNDMDKKLYIEVYDHDKASKNDLIGVCETTGNQLVEHQRKFTLYNPKNKNKARGVIEVVSATVKKIYTFEDYSRNGLNFSTVIRFDMTGSPSTEFSHSIGMNTGSEYESAIQNCANAITQIDTGKMFPIWGFGAVVGNETNHSFILNLNPTQPKDFGLVQIIQTYRQALTQIQLGKNKQLSNTLFTAKNLIDQELRVSGNNYFILFIFVSDGQISDLKKTKDMVVELSEMPISIFIIGIGPAKFADFSIFDNGWKNINNSIGKSCKRDCVTFIDYRDFVSQLNHNQITLLLNNQISETIKNQVISYFKMIKVCPENLNQWSVNLQSKFDPNLSRSTINSISQNTVNSTAQTTMNQNNMNTTAQNNMNPMTKNPMNQNNINSMNQNNKNPINQNNMNHNDKITY